MKLDTTATLNTRTGEPFQRPVSKDTTEPLTIGWACVEALDAPPAEGTLTKVEKIKRDRLATRIFEAMMKGEPVDLAAEDQVLLTQVLDRFLATPRALAEAIRLVDPESFAKS